MVGFAAGATVLAQVALGFALVAAVLNAVFGFCLGCEMYLLLKRSQPAHSRPEPTQPDLTRTREKDTT